MSIKVGLIGFGMGGRIFHAPLINHVEGLELYKIRETRPENVAIANERYPQATIVKTSEEIISDPLTDLVVLAVPNSHHYELAKEALEAGKHVVVEKPFTVTSAQADDLILLAKKAGKILSVYQNRRWDSDFLTVGNVIRSGKLGRLVEYEAHYDRYRNSIRPNTWKEEGSKGTGLLFDLGSHLIDQALSLFGRPEMVSGFTGIQRENSKIIDHFEIIMHYRDVKVTLKSGMLVLASLPKYILLGTNGSFVKYGQDVQEADLNAQDKSLHAEDWGREPTDLWGTITYAEKEKTVINKVESAQGSYISFYKNIYGALTGKEKLVVTPKQARDTIRVIELAEESSRMKKSIEFS